jgi:hypothetical protein
MPTLPGSSLHQGHREKVADKYLALAKPAGQFHKASYRHEERHKEILSLKIVAVLVAGSEGPILFPTVSATVVSGCWRESHGRYGQDDFLSTAVQCQRERSSNAGKDESSGIIASGFCAFFFVCEFLAASHRFPSKER